MTSHSTTERPATNETTVLVGHPNVGKSTLFQALTGHRVVTANYAGTTVEVTRAAGRLVSGIVVDSPGLLTFPSRTEDEQVTARILLEERPHSIVQVGDAKNLRRTLLLTLQLAELGVPMVLALNMADEAKERGIEVDARDLAEMLGTSVVQTTAVRGIGVSEVAEGVETARAPAFRVSYPAPVEQSIEDLNAWLPESATPTRALALLWLSHDPVAESWILERTSELQRAHLFEARSERMADLIQEARLHAADALTRSSVRGSGRSGPALRAWLGHAAAHPVMGLPFLGLVLLALYAFVGLFGAGVLVDVLEGHVFGEIVNPAVTSWVDALTPTALVRDAVVGEFGLWTMGLTYAVALILPIVTTFFIAFGVLEDSGYLPRLAVMTNRVFRAMGLNGQAVVPMVLGLGCVTMATMATRTLASRRERLLVILLLALGIPCSAQLGVVMGMLGGVSIAAVMIWSGVVAAVLIAVGWTASRVLPGERSVFVGELPPLRRPRFRPVVVKTAARVEWYLREVVPLFLIGSALLFAADVTGVLAWLIEVSRPVVTDWLRLPPDATTAFLMGFFRRDFGATGLFVIASTGALTAAQVVVSMTTITLFVPCVASVLMIVKERGWRVAATMVAIVFPLAILVGGLLGRALEAAGWGA